MSNCILCGSNVAKLANHNFVDADGVSQRNYVLNICTSCGSGFVSPQPIDDEMVSLYSEGVYKSQGGKGGRAIGALLNSLHQGRLHEINKIVGKPGRLLDIGCGKGRFLYNAIKIGWEAEGQDYSAAQASLAEAKTGAKVWVGDLESLPLSSCKYDVVTMWHVLEHMPTPQNIVKVIHGMLAKDGLLVIEVPNFYSWQAKVGGGKWFQLDIPRHLWQFTPKGIDQLLQRNGFDVISIKTWSGELGPFGMLQTLLNRCGLPPQWFFRYLKRSMEKQRITTITGNVLAAACLILPAIFIEILASGIGRGGVVRILAKRSDT